jgi:hypothetical protein
MSHQQSRSRADTSGPYVFPSLKKIHSLNPLSKLRRESVLTPGERDQIPSMVAAAERDEEACEREITRLYAVIESLKNVKREIQDAIQVTRSLLSPVHRIPDDILAEILLHRDMRILVRDRLWIIPALKMQSVCSRWHSIVNSGKLFWSKFEIVLRYGLSPHFQDVFKTVLARSGDASLDVYLDFNTGTSSSLLPILHANAHRFRSLDISQVTGSGFEQVLSKPMPMLKSIRVDNGPTSFDPVTLVSPNLRYAALASYPPKIHLPWSQLSHIDLYLPTVKEFITLLAECQSLTTAELTCWEDMDSSMVEHLACVSHPKLTFFSVHLQDLEDCEALMLLFSKVTLSKLSSLHLSADLTAGQWPLDAFESFLERSKCILTDLALEVISLSTSLLLATLQLLPHIKRLEIRESYFTAEEPTITNSLIDQMIAGQGSDSADRTSYPSCVRHVRSFVPFLPDLETIEFKGKCTADDFSTAKFLDMVRSRWRLPEMGVEQVKSLKWVKLRMRGQEMDEASARTLEHLQRIGINVYVHAW